MSDEMMGKISQGIRNLKQRFSRRDEPPPAEPPGDELLEAISEEELPQLTGEEAGSDSDGGTETIEIESEKPDAEDSVTKDLAEQIEFYVGEIKQARSTLQEAFDKLGGQIEDLTSTAGKLSDAMAARGTQGDQVKVLEEIRNQLDSMSLSNQQMIGALEAIPKTAREQAKALAQIGNRLEDDGKTDKELFGQLDRIGRGLVALAKSNEVQQQTIRDTNEKLQAHLTLTEMQGKKLARFRTVTLVMLIVLVIVAGMIAAPIVMGWLGMGLQAG